MSTLNVVTWNVNGIRSRIFNDKLCAKLPKNQNFKPEENSSMYNLIKNYNPDIICLQETRCDIENGSKFNIDCYSSYFNCSKLDGARSSNRYSGTAIYSKIVPLNIEYTVPEYQDQEGRIMIAHFENFIVINVYSPNSGTNYENKKLFQNAILKYIQELLIKNNNLQIIYCGDFNVAIDTHFDKTTVPESPGIYKHELQYYDTLIENGFIDSKSQKDNLIFTWWDQRGKKVLNEETGIETNILRLNNKGWRIDYVFTKNIKYSESFVLKHIGEEYSPHASDHAPVCCSVVF